MILCIMSIQRILILYALMIQSHWFSTETGKFESECSSTPLSDDTTARVFVSVQSSREK